MEKIDLHENVFVIKNFFSDEECNTHTNYCERQQFEEAKVAIHGKQTMMKGVRNNDRILFKNNDLAEKLWNRVQSMIPENMGLYKAMGLNEMFRFYRYTKGQRFKMHKDGSYKRTEKECTFFSFIIYLNDDFEGGETEFRKLFSVKPEKGMALLFHHPYRHEGKEILSGTKYVLRTDVMYKMD